MNSLKTLLRIFLALGILAPISAATTQPWLVALDTEKGLTYFDAEGRQLSRSKLLSPSKIEDCLDIELGDFIKGDGWFELILLRKGYWFETFPLPKPGEPSVKRIDYYRFQPVSGYEPVNLALVNYLRDPEKLAMAVGGRRGEDSRLDQLVLYEVLNTGQRSQVRVMSVEADWPEVSGGIRLAALGLNCQRGNVAVLTTGNSLLVGSLDAEGAAKWMDGEVKLPSSIKPRHICLVADRVYLLDGKNRIHSWIIEGEELKPTGKPVRLDLPLEVMAFTPIHR
jgi:hypothetical protein